MRRSSKFVVLFLLMVVPLVLAAPALAQERTFSTSLSGSEEVPPVDTGGSGQAEVVISADGMQASFRVQVSDLEDTTMAHIHLGARGENGPPIVWLHSQDQAPELIAGEFSGTLASGTFTADDLVGPLEGGTLADLVAELAAGNTYVNVHTEANPGGEIRGQLSEVDAGVEQAERIDTGAGGTARTGFGSTGGVLAGVVAMVAAGIAIARRRVRA
jgi:hypothetical protein